MFRLIPKNMFRYGIEKDNILLTRHQFSDPWNDSDVKLIVEYKEQSNTFHVHSLVLSIASPVFAESLKNDENEETKEIKLFEKDPNIVLRMLQIIYPIDGIISDKECIPELLSFAKEYRIASVFLQVDHFLASTTSTVDLKYFILAEQFKMKKTWQKCVKYCVTNDNILLGNWEDIKDKTKLMILHERIERLCPACEYLRLDVLQECRVFKKRFSALKQFATEIIRTQKETVVEKLINYMARKSYGRNIGYDDYDDYEDDHWYADDADSESYDGYSS